MNRVIKFRALYEGAWYYQTLQEIITVTLAAFRLGNHKTQYTGLEDKNGKEAYEGDLIWCYAGSKKQTWNDTIGFKDGCFYLLRRGISINEWLHHENFKKIEIDPAFEVYSNLYENPELLEESTPIIIEDSGIPNTIIAHKSE